VSFLLDPLHVISKPGSAAWQAAGVKNSTPKREPKEPAIAVLGPVVRLEARRGVPGTQSRFPGQHAAVISAMSKLLEGQVCARLRRPEASSGQPETVSVVGETRKLAAILVADVVGYSRLAGADEVRTLARLRGLRSDLIDPAIAAHNGRIVKRTGDGSIIEFRSVVDAVRCAIEVQSGTVERNAGLPQERRIEFRIGIHLGDVVEEADDGDLMGDGVNIAARLEGIAKPGAICLSEDAYRQVKSRLDLQVSDLGATQLKNIVEPIRVYSLQAGVAAQTPPAIKTRPTTKEETSPPLLPEKPSIAVLPFENMSGDPEQDYFCDGMVEDIITGLSRIKWLFVIARNSSFTYKSKCASRVLA
jgi:class 3 adenylate cyclase